MEKGKENNKEYKGNSKGKKKPVRYNKSESLEDIIARRNKRLVALFKLADIPIRIIGNENSPAIIYNEEKIMNAYVHNFDLNFMDAHYGGKTIYTVRLLDKPKFDRNKILECINNYPSNPVYKVKLIGTSNELFLAGYNFLDKEQGLGRYPVFAGYHAKLYFSDTKALEIAEELNGDGYNCMVTSIENK